LHHTLSVAEIAGIIASALGLNEDLARAGANSHDIGMPPFGHDGESTLNELMSTGFTHEENSARIARELNLTDQTIDCILNHDTNKWSKYPEGHCMKWADKISRAHDFEDALTLGKAPADFNWAMFGLGNSYSEWIDTLVKDVIANSTGKKIVDFSPEMTEKFKIATDYEYKEIIGPIKKRRGDNARETILTLWEFYNTPGIKLRDEQRRTLPFYSPAGHTEQEICDHISRMTDTYALNEYRKINSIWHKKHYFKGMPPVAR
jgi:dGTPase